MITKDDRPEKLRARPGPWSKHHRYRCGRWERRRDDKGNSGLDHRNVFVASAVYDLPFGGGQHFVPSLNRAVDSVLGGRQLNTVVQAETGNPFSIYYPSYGGVYMQQANSNGLVTFPLSILGSYFTGSFSAPRRIGCRAPGTQRVLQARIAEGDIPLFKNVVLSERDRMELRREVFNVINTPQFTNPDGNLNDGTFGQVTSTRTVVLDKTTLAAAAHAKLLLGSAAPDISAHKLTVNLPARGAIVAVIE